MVEDKKNRIKENFQKIAELTSQIKDQTYNAYENCRDFINGVYTQEEYDYLLEYTTTRIKILNEELIKLTL